MKLLQFISDTLIVLFFSSADMHLFGSRKRRKEKEKLSKSIMSNVEGVEQEIDALKSLNPFDAASYKSAMAQTARSSKQLANRYANMLGANASPEAIIAAQGQTQQAVANTAGDIATGAEANKQAQLAQLENQKLGIQSQAWGTKQSSIDERGSGWSTMFQGLQALGGVAEGVGAVV